MTPWDDAVLVGTIARTQGHRGEVIVNAETDFPEDRFQVGAMLRTKFRDGSEGTLEVTAMRMHHGRPVLALKGIGTMDDAERLAGVELRIEPGQAERPLPDGEYFQRDLVGCVVVTERGERVGRVTAVEGDRGQSRLVVTGGRSEILIPLADEICQVDLQAKRIVVRPPEGLLDLNGDWR